jgi:hypothetical protein
LGGPPVFCVQCGHELKLPTRFCTACGRAVGGQGIPAREREVTATMAPPRREGPVPPPPARDSLPAPAGAGRNPPRSPHSPRRGHRWWPLVFPAAAVLAAGITALYLFVLRTPHAPRPGAGGHSSAPPAGTTPASSASSSPSPAPAEQQAASSLAALLAQSTSDRSATVSAVNDVSNCGPSLSQDQQALENSAASRTRLLGRLASLPGRSALPPQMLQDLTNAWNESVAADRDLARWAQDESSQGCSQDAQSDPNYAAANDPDTRAKADKIAFVGEWNPIAEQYGLTSYKWDQL